MFKDDSIRKGFFEHEEFLALRKAVPEYARGFCTFACRSGWRRTEIASLTWSQVDRAQAIVTLNPGETKSGAGRTMYLDNELRGVIAEQWERRKRSGWLTPFVFTNQSGTGRIGGFRKSWKSSCKTAKIGDKLFHDLRRTAIRNMVRAGTAERVVMQISGHKTRSVFGRYDIVSDADLRVAPERLSAYLDPKIGAICHDLAKIGDFQTEKEAAGKVANN